MSLSGGYNEAIRNSIIDFSNTSSLFKEDSSFSVYYEYLKKENLHLVSILGTSNKKIIIEGEVSSVSPNFPNNHYLYSGKLFYWHDENSGSSQATLSQLQKFNLLDTVPTFFEAVTINDDSKTGVDYYICKGDIYRYKKVRTKIAFGHYPIPQINCGD